MKYFIENELGEWLIHPQLENGPGNNPWTRDPGRAWQFGIGSGEDSLCCRSCHVLNNKDISVPYRLDRIIWDFINEGLLTPTLKITEHEFFELYSTDYLRDNRYDLWHNIGTKENRVFERMYSAY